MPQPGRPVPSRAYPGALIVVEGTDGSGKSTQLYLLKRWLEIGGYRLHFTEWNSSPLVKSATRRGKQRRLLTPTTFSLLHAADFADRCERQIMPLLQGDYLVLADRYIYTAFARDAARGCPARWLRNLYRFAPVPDITFYFRAPLDVAVHRILSGRPKLKYYEAGMDLGMSYDRAESFRLFQARILEEYDKMVDIRQLRRARRHHPRQQAPKTDARHRRLQNRSQAFCPSHPGSGVSMPDQDKEKEKHKDRQGSEQRSAQRSGQRPAPRSRQGPAPRAGKRERKARRIRRNGSACASRTYPRSCR